MRHLLAFIALCSIGSALLIADEWPQGAGGGDFTAPDPAPVAWSVTRNENIAWKRTLPETGQSTPVICAGRVYFTTLKPVANDSELGQNLVAWSCNAATGEVIWKHEIPGRHPLRLSGCFSDSSSPPATCDGERVVFVNASGTVAAFSLDGSLLWSREMLTAGRTVPFLHDGKLILTRQIYPPDPNGNFPHKYADSPREMWTQLHALDLASGEDSWTSSCGVNMGCVVLPQRLEDGRPVAVVGRGGGHGPPEKPDGISLVDLSDGSTLWTLPLENFMSTMSYRVRADIVPVFHEGEHLWVDAKDGDIVKRVSIIDNVMVRLRKDTGYVTRTLSIPDAGKHRMITQTSNLVVGRWHYFRSYTRPWLGRVNLDTGSVEYLELPLQLARTPGKEDAYRWYAETENRKDPQLKDQALVANSMKNSRGFVVMGDKRSRGNGWGHVAAATPSVAGSHLYIPVQNGTVYVLRWNDEILDENSVVAINDLGPAGEAFTRASLSSSDGRIYAHTIRELICIDSR